MISLVVAINKNLAIGNNNKLLWKNPEDLKEFKKLTLNSTVIMGNNTYKSLGKPLPYRTNIVVTTKSLPEPSEANYPFQLYIFQSQKTHWSSADGMNAPHLISDS